MGTTRTIDLKVTETHGPDHVRQKRSTVNQQRPAFPNFGVANAAEKNSGGSRFQLQQQPIPSCCRKYAASEMWPDAIFLFWELLGRSFNIFPFNTIDLYLYSPGGAVAVVNFLQRAFSFGADI